MPVVLIGLVVVNIESVRFAVPPLNSAAAPEAVMASALPGVAGAAFMVNVVAPVTVATVALLAKPVPPSDIPFTRPFVRSQVMAVLNAVVVALVKETPAAVSVRPEPVPEAACESTNVVPFVMEAMVVLPVAVPLMLPGMFGPVINMPGHSAEVLAQVTVVLPFVVAAAVMLIGKV